MKKTLKQNQMDTNSEINSNESSPATTPVHIVKNDSLSSNVLNSFNSMDLQSPTNRNLSDKELRDCDVIGMFHSLSLYLNFLLCTHIQIPPKLLDGFS